MAMKNIYLFVATFLVLFILSLITPTALSISHHHRHHDHHHRHHDHTISRWCSQTPHPGPCNYYISRRFAAAPRRRLEFRKMLIQVAMERALEARGHASQLESSCENKPHEKAAWRDCLKLYDGTVLQLNRTLSGLGGPHKRSCTDFDAQTWLSTALTNIDTCQTGSSELNVSEFITPVACGYNVSELLCNSLAVNAKLLENQEAINYNETDHDRDFPSWVSNRERRMLESPGIKANLVVAKDGSGHFRSVQEAINRAARRRIHSRFVIHVKRGVYRENIEVGVGNRNIMLVGDGLRYTIITSGRSVKAGYTTYSSATAGT
ncbi:putative pectinesterase/pectinesterase inhibitor 60 [Morus notabilis]|uniref:Putative pectinesterase/pectinesterase inhibitor 60 n=1 Tax=Morus notabilis TaxID=981085 RepID=W9SDY8_9ROSA|nr:putative pectinesterase/pectinesterase inhibitor 60 [Morus notabilis]